MKYYRCGKILTTHGLKGDLKIASHTDFERFKEGGRLYICHQNEYVAVTVKRSVPFGKYILIRLEGLEDINLVEKYHGDEIFIPEEDRKEELEEGEFYYSDLIGKAVFNQLDEQRGEVIDVVALPAGDYLYIRYQNKNHYVPFNDVFVQTVSSDRIVIREMEGLFR
ncbi:MAG TPA: 16S rRNA processing protein RimM [Candidatus Pelethenecus faecipullorum]|uniref:Ribosome maturation factor RimM n=1 Tax=Candidatus Pelethenecus faecipullorum TaxID=2840900 RepID=A0A9D1GQX1_9MOLU|nr:16S rRNA processing protein RimM [Candidatus Pelethenecus faecipullorum]